MQWQEGVSDVDSEIRTNRRDATLREVVGVKREMKSIFLSKILLWGITALCSGIENGGLLQAGSDW